MGLLTGLGIGLAANVTVRMGLRLRRRRFANSLRKPSFSFNLLSNFLCNPIWIIIVGLGFAVWDYERRMASSSLDQEKLPDATVVFTGGMERIYRGLDLLKQGETGIFFISGIDMDGTYQQEMMARHLAKDGLSLDDFDDGRLMLGGKARNTLQNGIETKCWSEREGISGPFLLISSTSHMPRASLVMEQALPKEKILRMTVPDRRNRSTNNNLRRDEFLKFLATSMITRLPIGEWNRFSGSIEVGCS